MKADSVDLRQKIIDAYNQREGSQRQLARRFRVSLSFIENLLKRYRRMEQLNLERMGEVR